MTRLLSVAPPVHVTTVVAILPLLPGHLPPYVDAVIVDSASSLAQAEGSLAHAVARDSRIGLRGVPMDTPEAAVGGTSAPLADAEQVATKREDKSKEPVGPNGVDNAGNAAGGGPKAQLGPTVAAVKGALGDGDGDGGGGGFTHEVAILDNGAPTGDWVRCFLRAERTGEDGQRIADITIEGSVKVKSVQMEHVRPLLDGGGESSGRRQVGATGAAAAEQSGQTVADSDSASPGDGDWEDGSWQWRRWQQRRQNLQSREQRIEHIAAGIDFDKFNAERVRS